MEKPRVSRTWWAGFSSGSQSMSLSEQPIRNDPGETDTNSIIGGAGVGACAPMRVANRRSDSERMPDFIVAEEYPGNGRVESEKFLKSLSGLRAGIRVDAGPRNRG